MGVFFRTKDGRKGMMDVYLHLQEKGLLMTGVQDGNVMFRTEDGTRTGMFNVADWALSNGYKIEKIDGFNTPITAVDIPPEGMTSLDQSVFYMDGKNVEALRGMYPEAQELPDGRVVVKDQDGLWKTMWSDNWAPPTPPPTYEEMAEMGQVLDLKKGMRAAGMALLFGLSGVDVTPDKDGEVSLKDVKKMFERLKHNLPTECRMIIAKIVEQTTGLDKWKFQSALINPDHVDDWMKKILKKTSFEIRTEQIAMSELLVTAMHELASDQFIRYMKTLEDSPSTRGFLCNLKEPVAEFIQILTQMDVINDISRITGLDEWKQMAKLDVDESKLPPMPDFVPKLVKLLHWCLPIYHHKELMLAKGKSGLRSVVSLMALVDDTLFSIRNVPESSAKTKMFMILKTLQAKLESKMAYYYHPMDDKTGVKVNEFMAIKAQYAEKREVVYKLVQKQKETWLMELMNTLREIPNLEAFYGTLPGPMRELIQSFVALDVAYDMQPWVDTNYQERLHDSFAMFTEEFGAPPPECGTLAKNSPRAALNIIETLSAAAGMLMAMPEKNRRDLMRSPVLLSKALKNMQQASIQREVGAVEILAKQGLIHMEDPYASPDPNRIWEDPDKVQEEIHQQMMQMLQQMQMEEQQRQIQLAQQEMGSQGAMPQGGNSGDAPAGEEAGEGQSIDQATA